MVPVEGNRWMVSLAGAHGDWPPGDWHGFLTYSQQLRTSTIYEAIKAADRLGDIFCFRFPASVRRHFERYESFPAGLVPFGDVLCRVNPAFGHGMSLVAQEACLLRRLLGKRIGECEPLAGLGPAFFAEAQSVFETPWATANLDFLYPETRGQRPPDFETKNKFGLALVRLAARDPAVHKLMAEVQQLLLPLNVYSDPELIRRLLAVMAEMDAESKVAAAS
jgi:hypothetical protein